MADKIKFLAGKLADLASKPKVQGQVYFAIDGETGKIAFDVDADTRIFMDKAGAADSATEDGSGNTITATYIKGLTLNNHATQPTYTLVKGNGNTTTKVNLPVANASNAGVITTGAQTFTGVKTINSNGGLVIQGSFEFSNIEKATNAAYRPVWFAYDGKNGTPVYDTKFQYNPTCTDEWVGYDTLAPSAYGSLQADRFTGLAQFAVKDDRGQVITNAYMKYPLSISGETITMTQGTGATSTITVPDKKVNQTKVDTANYRPLILGYTNNTDGSALTATSRNQVYFASSIYAQPSTGTIFATKFKGDLEGNATTATNAEYANKDINNVLLTSYIKSVTKDDVKVVVKTGAGSSTSFQLNFVPLAGGTMTGKLIANKGIFVNTATNTNNFVVARNASAGESTSFGQDDNGLIVHTVNDETTASVRFILDATDTEGGNGAAANSGTISFGLASGKTTINADNFSGLAAKATQDASGQTITSTYIKAITLKNHATLPYYVLTKGSGNTTATVNLPVATSTDAGVITTAAQTLKGNKTLVQSAATSTALQSGTLILSHGSGNAVGLEFWRGASYASWQVVNDSGNLIFRSNYDDGIQTSYNVTSLQLNHTTGAGQIPYLGIGGANTGYRLYVNGLSYFNGNITYNSGTKNMMMWLDNSKVVKASNHYVNASKLAVNYTTEPGYNFYVEGTSYFNGNIFLPNSKSIIQNQNTTSNYTTAIAWYKGGTKTLTYAPSVGHHSTGNTTGAMILLPYETDAEPWGGSVGLYLGKGVLKLDGKEVFTANSYTTLDNRYVNVSGDTMTGSLTATNFTASTENALNTSGVMRIKSASTLYLNRGSSTSLIFQLNGSGHARFDTSGNFIPEADNTYNIGVASTQRWRNVYAVTFHGALSGNATSANKVNKALTINNKTFDGSAAVNVGTIGTAYGGTGVTTHAQNTLVWATSATTLQGGNHYASATQIAIASTSKPSYTLYVNGTAGFKGDIVNNTGATSGNITLTATTASVGLKIGTTGNHGVYSETKAKWIVYSDVDGNITVNGNALSANKVNKALSVNGKSYDGSAAITVGTIGTAYGGTGVTTHTQNRIVYATSSTSIQAGGSHYINGTKLAINSTSEPSYNFYVNGTSFFSNTIDLSQNLVNIMFRRGTGYDTTISYQTSGNEALVAATKNAVTSFIFINGEDTATNIAADRWTKITPALQIKNNSVYIGSLIASGTTPAYKFYVNGTSHLNGATSIAGPLTITGTSSSTANLIFKREGYNYIIFPSTGNLAFATTASGEGIVVGVSSAAMYPYINNAKTLGTSALKWSNVYATTFTGNLSGNAATASIAKDVAVASYRTTDGEASYILIKINSSQQNWMTAFTVRVYQGYEVYDVTFSGYQYGSNYWYSPKATLTNSSTVTSTTAYFGYNSATEMWVALPGSSYTGAKVINVVNGYQPLDIPNAFSITRVSSLPGTLQTTQSISRPWRRGESVTGAVWNDYAECRESDTQEAGYVLSETGKDNLVKTTERLQHFAGVSSDTWGFSQGETEKAKTPIAVAGRVLVYPYQDRNNYQPGDCVCAAPGGTVDIMTRAEVIEYPDRIVGTVSYVPDYETWGGGESADREPVKVNGRIWIKVK